MTRYALYIPTTNGFGDSKGTVQVLGVEVVGGKLSLALTQAGGDAIPGGYLNFAGLHKGAVGEHFPPPDGKHWRLLLSSAIDDGNSWQLGAFLAHAIHAAPQHQLIRDLDKADVVLWVSGKVQLEGDILPVQGINEKLAGLDAPDSLFGQWRKHKLPVKWILHQQNADQLRHIFPKIFPNGMVGDLVEIEHINALPAKLGLPHEALPKSRYRVLITATVALLALAAVVMLSLSPSKPPALEIEPALKPESVAEPVAVAEPKPAKPTAVSNIQVIELLAELGQESCASVWAENAKPRLQILTTLTPDHPKQNITPSPHFCGLRLARQTTTQTQQHAWLCDPPQHLRLITWGERSPSRANADTDTSTWQRWYERQTTAKLILTLTATGCVSIR